MFQFISDAKQEFKSPFAQKCLRGDTRVMKQVGNPEQRSVWTNPKHLFVTTAELEEGLLAAIRGGHYDLVQLLLPSIDKRVFPSAMMEASREGHLSIIELLLSKGSTDFDVCMYYLCLSGHPSFVRFILPRVKLHYDVDLPSISEHNVSSVKTHGLAGACKAQSITMARLMISAGGDIMEFSDEDPMDMRCPVSGVVWTARKSGQRQRELKKNRHAVFFAIHSIISADMILFLYRLDLIPYNSNWIPWHIGSPGVLDLVAGGIVPSAFTNRYIRAYAQREVCSHFGDWFPVRALQQIVVNYL